MEFRRVLFRSNAPNAAFADPARKIHCVQFHPEVAHTPRGEEILANFLFRIAGARATWTMHSFVEQAVADVKAKVGNGPVGDLSKKITVDVKGEILELKNTINVMVDQLSSFA